ncbi:MAG: hypothetical protein RIM72_09980 [Alphaproteobacteria bacterium]
MPATFGSVRLFARCSLLFLIAIAVLAGCSGNEPLVRCPSIRVPVDTGTMTRFVDGSDGDITDVIMETRFTAARGVCSVDDDLVEVEAILEIGVREGPASTSSVGSLSIFVAVADKDRTILQRRSLPVAVDFSGNRSTVLHRERLVIEIPKTEEQRGDSFVIFTGFELSKDELRFNRATQ